MCLLWMEFVILRVLKRTLFHVTDHGAWLSNLYLLGSPLLLFFLVKRPFKEAYLGMNTIISSYILEVDLIIISSGISVSQQKIVLCLLRIS